VEKSGGDSLKLDKIVGGVQFGRREVVGAVLVDNDGRVGLGIVLVQKA
jgi:hypothetical protein